MEQDSKRFNRWGLTGDPDEDRRRKTAMLIRINKMRKAFEAGHHVQIDLLSGLGGTVAPEKSKSKGKSAFQKEQETIMKALALDLHEYIPEDMALHYGFTTRREADENPSTAPFIENDPEIPF
ncbi:MAG: hypothetical protein ACRBB0_26815 [Pelagimonas sp.]|uniref:hypothetical protein n=1 Tax=Pelagimonas sp. TaxID=2073170 RepID=UPI003D6B07FF